MTGWTIVVPVKRLDEAKSRLAPASAGMPMAFLADLLAAAAGAELVIATAVVTSDPHVREFCEQRAVRTLAEGRRVGLNAAIGHALTQIGDAHSVAIITADLPCLTSSALDEVLGAAPRDRCSFVCDTPGIGTTTLLMPAGLRIQSRFGHRSRAAHREAGCVELAGTTPSFARMRRDVDTPVDLWDATRLGVGPATQQALSQS